ncbi:MAG: hypothetical protein KGM16_07795 [Bacteroidota bacterium]|nr:hypothetical protein [Bacteroidota bacterium]
MNTKLIVNIFCLFTCLQVLSPGASAQVTVSGNVYDVSKLYAVPGVQVSSTSGSSDVTDSTGSYQINVSTNDSIIFTYNGKSTMKFPVKDIKNYSAFDISIHAKVKEKYKLLDPVTVFTDSYKFDSLENREEYAKIFGDEKPGIHSTYDPGGAAGLDLDALIGMFQFRKNKEQLAFKKRLLQEEEDRYVDYKFSSKTITRITGLTGDSLETYKKMYRPDYYFVVSSTLTQFYQYILNTSYAFKRKQKDY